MDHSDFARPAPHDLPATHTHLSKLILNVASPNDQTAALLEAHHTLTGEALTPAVFRTEAARLNVYNSETDWPAMSANDHGRYFAVATLRQIFEQGGMQWDNLLRSWPMYEHLYKTFAEPFGRRAGNAGNKKALLVGALHALSARTFVVLAKEVYGMGEPWIVDLEAGADKQRHGNFKQGDARKLPFPAESMRLVQTNFLFQWLGDKLWASDAATQSVLARLALHETFRVLHPGGHLLLVENAFGYEFGSEAPESYNWQRVQAFKVFLRSTLGRIGFEHIIIEPAYTFDGIDYLFDASRDFSRHPRQYSPSAFGVYARKPGGRKPKP